MINNQLKNEVDKWSNSFLRPFIPTKLLSNSEIIRTEDDGAKLIYLKFLYGIRTGQFSERPTDGGIGNIIRDINEESLWIYSLRNEKIPDGFTSLKKKDSGIIGTGDIRKCSTCRGQGKVRCKTCGGKVRWTSKDFEGNRVENVCSCGDGKQMCSSCDGYGDVEIIIITQREFKLFDIKNSQYTGKVPTRKIKKITGDLVYEQVYDYPLDMVREMLIGGIDSQEFNRLNNAVLGHLKQSIDDQLKDRGDIDTNKIHSQLDELFNSLPNPGKENKVLEHEAIPIRVMVRVENAPVKKIDYKFKDKNYSLWVYGKENSVWKQKAPKSLNHKGITLSILLLSIISASTFFYIDNKRSYHSNNYNTNNSNNNYEENYTTNNANISNINNSINNNVSTTSGKSTIITDQDSLMKEVNQDNSKNDDAPFPNGQLAITNDSDEFTYVRSGKGTNTSIVYKLPSTEIFTVYPSNEKWWKVKLSNRQSGFIFHEKISLTNKNSYSQTEIDSILVGTWKYNDRLTERNIKFEKDNTLKMSYGETNNGNFIKYGGNYGVEFNYYENGIEGYYFQNTGGKKNHPKIEFQIQIVNDSTIREITKIGKEIYSKKN